MYFCVFNIMSVIFVEPLPRFLSINSLFILSEFIQRPLAIKVYLTNEKWKKRIKQFSYTPIIIIYVKMVIVMINLINCVGCTHKLCETLLLNNLAHIQCKFSAFICFIIVYRTRMQLQIIWNTLIYIYLNGMEQQIF